MVKTVGMQQNASAQYAARCNTNAPGQDMSWQCCKPRVLSENEGVFHVPASYSCASCTTEPPGMCVRSTNTPQGCRVTIVSPRQL